MHFPISIHAPRVGSDAPEVTRAEREPIFQSTLPVWGATASFLGSQLLEMISIHAPRVGSDRDDSITFTRDKNFNPRSPCGERPGQSPRSCRSWQFQSTLPVWGATTITAKVFGLLKPFQSTLPVWGATSYVEALGRILRYFNPRSPCGERRDSCPLPCCTVTFQSTLPVWGATRPTKSTWTRPQKHFNPRSPCGERLLPPDSKNDTVKISIHAPRVGSDR